MNVLILGPSGMIGPLVVKALEDDHRLRLADIREAEGVGHEFAKVDISALDEVTAAAEGMDAIINLCVERRDRRLAFDVSTRGCYNVMVAAVRHGIRRVINTGPHSAVVGSDYGEFDYDLEPDLPPHPGTGLYSITKYLGLEICRTFTEHHDVHVMSLLYPHLIPKDQADGVDFQGPPEYRRILGLHIDDTAEACVHALNLDLSRLPSRFEVFFVMADVPHRKFSIEKTKRILGWQTKRLERFWIKQRTKPAQGGKGER